MKPELVARIVSAIFVIWAFAFCQNLHAQKKQEPESQPATTGRAMSVDLSDDFDGEFEIEWDVLRPDEEMVSLETNPGQLTLTTQRGSINGDSENDALTEGVYPKNFFLVPNELDESVDFQIEIKVSDFHPSGYYHQCGIMLYNDDDNYLKLGFEYHLGHDSGLAVTWGVEVDQESKFQWKDPGDTSELVLRLVRREDKFYGYAGKQEDELQLLFDAQEWDVDEGPQKVGLYAKNGGNPATDQIEVQFDYFRFTSEVEEIEK